MSKYYTAVGSRKGIPKEIAELMPQISAKLESQGWILRSGMSLGSDLLFSSGVKKAQQWLPWPNFNIELQLKYPDFDYRLVQDDADAEESLKLHPKYPDLEEYSKKMHRRNFRQVIGLNEPNSSFVLCWTENGEVKGGTAQALRVAAHYKIPVFNLAKEDDLTRILKWIH